MPHKICCSFIGIFLVLIPLACQDKTQSEPSPSPRDALLARADSLELKTEYVPPPGDALEHHTSGFAKILCSAVFITGLDADFAAEYIGYFTSPYEERAHITERVTYSRTSLCQPSSMPRR